MTLLTYTNYLTLPFLTNIEPLYRSFSTRNKQLFANFAFPKGVMWENGKYRTPEVAYIFSVLKDLEADKSIDLQMVTLPGIEPEFPG